MTSVVTAGVDLATASFADWSRELRRRIEHCLDSTLPHASISPKVMHEAMRYAVLGGGKRIRPLLSFAAGALTGAPAERLNHVACAVELMHAYSLVHDDLPAMDDDALRRGKPTVHVQYDQATAILVGDSLQSLAFQILAQHRLCDDAAQQLKMIELLAAASGSRGMAGGQAIDLANVNQSISLPELELMHIHKTGALIRAAILLGAHCGELDDGATLRGLDYYAKHIGLAFQVVDDLLDAQGSTASLGKTAGKDARANKPTYVSIMGLAGAKTFAHELHEQACQALQGFGTRAQRLKQIADFIIQRHA